MIKTNKESNYRRLYHPNIINHYNDGTFFFLMMGVHLNGWPDSKSKDEQDYKCLRIFAAYTVFNFVLF